MVFCIHSAPGIRSHGAIHTHTETHTETKRMQVHCAHEMQQYNQFGVIICVNTGIGYGHIAFNPLAFAIYRMRFPNLFSAIFLRNTEKKLHGK